VGIGNRAVFATVAAAGFYAGVSSAMAAGLTRTKRIFPDDTPETVGLPFEDIVFRPRGGGPDLSGWLIPAPGKSVQESIAESPWVVTVHGFGTNRTDPSVGLIGLARDLSAFGYAIVMFDARACGRSGGSSGSVGYYERLDLLGALDMLSRRGVTPSRTVIMGFSLGAAVALLVGSVPGNCAAIVADSPFADLRLTIRHTSTGLLRSLVVFHPGMKLAARTLFGIDIDELSPAKALAASDVPCLVIHGGRDKYVPRDHAALLARALAASPAGARNGGRQLWEVPEAGHVQAYRTERGAYVDKVAAFLAAQVGGTNGRV